MDLKGNLLTILIFLPTIGAVLTMLVKGRDAIRWTALGTCIVTFLLSLLLFAYFVRKAGVPEIIVGIKRLSAGFLLILAISAVRQVARSLVWTRCFESPYHLRFRDAFAARVMGDALGNIIPLASVAVSEASRFIASKIDHRLPSRYAQAVSAATSTLSLPRSER